MATINNLVNQIYQEQLGRAPDPEGAQYWASQLAAGASPQAVTEAINRSREGVEFDTQAIESVYRQQLGRTAESPGAQYWLSAAQATPLTNEQLRQTIIDAAQAERAQRNINQIFTELELADLIADPWGGRRPINNIYDIPANEADRINISYINGIPVQFVNPITEASYISRFGQGAYEAAMGEETLIPERVTNSIRRALESGSMTSQEANRLLEGLKTVETPDDVRAVLGLPKGAVIIDPTYGQQIGEDNELKLALAEAARRQEVLSAQDPGYYQASDVLGQAYLDAGIPWAFMLSNYPERTMATQADKLTPENFRQRINQLIQNITGDKTISGRFGALNDLQTPLTGQYYSETGLQPGFTPFGTEGTTFRSGVAGYIPQAELPTGFQFGAPPVNATFQQYRPGAFQPEGVTTGGFITGYTQAGQPIYSTYANPNVNVGGTNSQLIPFANQAGMLTDLQNQIAALQANQSVNQGHSQGS